MSSQDVLQTSGAAGVVPFAAAVLESHNPATGALLGSVPVAGTEAVRAAVDAARAAQPAWAARPVAERARVVLAFRRAMLARADWLTERIAAEQGRPVVEALTQEVLPVADLITYYTRRARRFLRDKRVPLHLLKYKHSLVHYQPFGVVAVISPWNYPFVLATSEVVLALLAGNAVVLKPSEYTPLVGAAIADLFREAGLPPDLLHVVQGDGRTGAALVEAAPDKITFIGGGQTARHILTAAAQHLTPVTLELGGKDPVLVLEDADLNRAADAVVWGGFCNAGQACASVERVYVARAVAPEFTRRVVERTRALRLGAAEGRDAPVDVGPLSNARQLAIVERHVAEAVAEGATVLVGGQRGDGPGYFYQPTVLADVRDEMAVMREETFGPVVGIATFETEEEAIRRANETPYGLSAYIFSRDQRRAQRLARRLEVGSVLINDVIMSYGAPETPWGGVKQSGIGRVHGGAAGLREYCQPRHIMRERFRPLAKELWWFPYRAGTYARMLRLMRLLWGR